MMTLVFEDFSIFPEVELREGDVFVSTGIKQGTTWSCYITQQLASHGKDDFEFLLDETPWVEYIQYPGQTKEDRLKRIKEMSTSHPRVFKTHCPPPILPLDPRARYVVCVRNPLDTLASYQPFINSRNTEFNDLWTPFIGPTNIPLANEVPWEMFAEGIFTYRADNYWPFVNAWWPHRFDKNVFFFHFADLRKDHAGMTKKLAQFLGADTSDEFIKLVVERTSFANMKKNEVKFEMIVAGKNREISMLRHGAMVRKGEIGDGKQQVPPEILEKYIQLCDTSCLNKEQLAWCNDGGEVPKN